MTKNKWKFGVLLLALVAALCVCFGLAACGTKYAVVWKVDEHVDVVVSGYDKLPDEVKEDTELTFTATGKGGYEVTNVKVNNRAVTANSDGAYTVTVRQETTIDVVAAEAITGVSVKTKPANLTYYAGETLDTAGMTVEVTYGTGRKEEVSDYSVVYANSTAFAIGDTSFTVRYKGYTSEAVDLASSVVAKLVINPMGGTISDDYYDALRQNSALSNVTKGSDGSISCTFVALSEDVALPSDLQISRGEGDDYTFTGWSGSVSSVPKETATSVTYNANYSAKLLTLTSVAYELREENGENVAYLVVKGNFRAAKTAYLYLYEGNDKVELVGPSVGGEDTQRGDEFTLLFPMKDLVAKGYSGKWMDIKFRAQTGDIIDEQEINLNEYADVEGFIDTAQKIADAGYQYYFEVYSETLKAVYTTYLYNEYTIVAGVDNDGKPTVTFNGKVSTTYAGKAVCIDWWVDKTYAAYGVIDEKGAYSVTFDLTAMPMNQDGYAHFSIVESATNTTVVVKGDGDANLLNSDCVNEDLVTVDVGLMENAGAIRCSNADGTVVYYVGMGKWSGVVLYGFNEKYATFSFTGVTLEKRTEGGAEKVYYVIHGTVGESLKEEDIKIYFNFQHNSNLDSVSWDYVFQATVTPATETEPATDTRLQVVIAEDGTFTVSIDVTDYEAGWVLTPHAGIDESGLSANLSVGGYEGTVTLGGKVYSIRCDGDTWNSTSLVITAA